MKAIIIAAGRGSRMNALTEQSPKCMLEVGGKPILHHAIDNLRSAGVTDIIIIRGYLSHLIDVKDVRYIDNPNWSRTNILGSLFVAREEIYDRVLIMYSDIIFRPDVVADAVADSHRIAPVVDLDWKAAYVGRSHHPTSEAEKVMLTNTGMIQRIGKLNVEDNHADGEFIGMLRLNPMGSNQFRNALIDAAKRYKKKSFQTARNFDAAYLTDLLQNIIENREPIQPIFIHGGWREIDTIEDLTRAGLWLDGS